MRALGLQGAELVVIPQAGAVGEWPPGLFEAELQAGLFSSPNSDKNLTGFTG